MKIIIQTPRLLASESLLEFVRAKVEKLCNHSNSIQEARVILKIDNANAYKNKVCEIAGVVSGADLFAAKQEATFDEAVLQAVEALAKQLVEWHGREAGPRDTPASA